MNIQIESTGNENIKKFVFDDILSRQGKEYKTSEEAKEAPVLAEILQFPFIEAVLVSGNFVGIQKTDAVDWSDVEIDIRDILRDHIKSGKKIIEAVSNKEIAFSVYAEVTPNPSVMKFVTNKLLVQNKFEFLKDSDTTNSPLAALLLKREDVIQVFFNQNFVSVTKTDNVEWTDISFELREEIGVFLRNGGIVVTKDISTSPNKEATAIDDTTLDDVSLKIKEILKEYVQPAVASDGGNIDFISYTPESKKVEVLLQGACSGCPSSTVTLKNGIETMLKEMLPQKIEEVVAING